MTEPREFCENCQRWLAHDQRYCPLFPDVKPPRKRRPARCGVAFAGEKWKACVCLVHTCYDTPKRDKAEAPEYRDFFP